MAPDASRRSHPVPRSRLPSLALAALLVATLAFAGVQVSNRPSGPARAAAAEPSCSVGTQLIRNGSFEQPGIGGAERVDYYQPDNWSGVVDAGSAAYVQTVDAPVQGNVYVLFIIGLLSQTVSTAGLGGATLELAFFSTDNASPTVTFGGEALELEDTGVRVVAPITVPTPAPATMTLSFNGETQYADEVEVVTLEVTACPVNDAPVIDGLSATQAVREDAGFSDTFTVSDTQTGADDLRVAVSQGDHGTATLTGSGSTRRLSYTPDADYSGIDALRVTVSDGVNTTTADVAITISPVNDPPVFDDGSVPDAITVPATTTTGAPASFTSPTATDPDGETPTVTCSPPSGSTFPIGTSTVTCTARDRAGRTDATSFPVTVTATGPTISVNGGPQDGATYTRTTVPRQPTCTARDVSGASVRCSVSGYSTATGPHTLTFTATDRAGNTTTLTRSYTVGAPASPSSPPSVAPSVKPSTAPSVPASAPPSRRPRTAAPPSTDPVAPSQAPVTSPVDVASQPPVVAPSEPVAAPSVPPSSIPSATPTRRPRT